MANLLFPVKFYPRPPEYRRTHVDGWRTRNLYPAVGQVLAGGKQLNSVLQSFRDVGVKLKESIERKLVLIVVKLAGRRPCLQSGGPALGKTAARLQRELVRRHLGNLQSYQGRVGRKAGDDC